MPMLTTAPLFSGATRCREKTQETQTQGTGLEGRKRFFIFIFLTPACICISYIRNMAGSVARVFCSVVEVKPFKLYSNLKFFKYNQIENQANHIEIELENQLNK